MKKIRLPSDMGIYLWLGLLFIVVLMLLPRKARFNYEYEKGAKWRYETLAADFDFPILKTASQLQEEKSAVSAESRLCYKYDHDVVRQALTEAEKLTIEPQMRGQLVELISEIYSRGVIDASQLPHDVKVVMIRKDKHYEECVASEIYTPTSACNALYEKMFVMNPSSVNLDMELNKSGAYDLITPNLKRDQEGEMLLQSYKGSEAVSPTMGYISAGQVIIEHGETISTKAYQLLESYKAEYSRSVGYSGPRFLLWLGNGLIAFIFCVMVFLAIVYCNPSVFANRAKFLYLLFIIALALTGSLLIGRARTAYLFIAPFTLFCLYLLPYFKKSLVALLYCIVLLVIPLFVTGGWEVYMVYLVAGTVTIIAVDRITKSWHQFIMALCVFASMMLTYIAFRLIEGTIGDFSADHIIFLALGAFLPVAGYPLIFLMERMFGMVSASRLEEYSDPSNKLLQELSLKAPGTFQHSLAVMNMADAVARSIDANVPLVRAGAMYHDIGKMANPLCFIENETLGAKYHQNLTTKQSAEAILRHVPDGLEIARKYKLPQIICEFIETHHGVSCTGYFYSKYVNEGGDPANKSDFMYKGRKPWTKEQAILMLCDSIEAASRTLKENSPEVFEAFVEKMVRAKMDDGQLDNCKLTIKELVTIKSVLKDYLGRLYHARIVYPASK